MTKALSAPVDDPVHKLTDGQWRDFSRPSLPPMLQAALDCFVEHGYHGTTIRVVAARAGLSVPGLYHHYPSKQALLVGIVELAMKDLLSRSEAAVADAGSSVEERFRLVVECLLLFHAYRSELAFIAASEIRSLEGGSRPRHIAQRDRQQRMVDEIVVAGVAEGVFSTPHAIDASRAVVTMCTGVAQWYRHGGPLTPEEVAVRYGLVARMAVGQPRL
ncbi:TetR/AcrR family transcriptional regulator [Arthrobacter sp. H14]|uniref:TetR/AcrR family transcriptional regulator n=1 Tax=Arthrobacter sp. H14 TaxID=1312959 RepID=UPI0004B8737A|nr:TetR/AcrR family transcriptional regulator [Arthrobacter sp. H14]